MCIYIYIHIMYLSNHTPSKHSYDICLSESFPVPGAPSLPFTGFQTGSGQTTFLQKCRNIP